MEALLKKFKRELLLTKQRCDDFEYCEAETRLDDAAAFMKTFGELDWSVGDHSLSSHESGASDLKVNEILRKFDAELWKLIESHRDEIDSRLLDIRIDCDKISTVQDSRDSH